MTVSIKKSSFHHHKLGKESLDSITSILHYKTFELEFGFKYLGFFLKPNDYRVSDWICLLEKIEKRVKN